MASMLIRFLLCAVTIFPASTAFAHNLLPNASFDTDLLGWADTAGKTWSPDDSDGSSSSGSLEIEVAEIGSTAISVCVPASAGEIYELRIDIKLDLQGNGTGRGGMVVRWMDDSECTEELPDFPANTFATFAPNWKIQAISAEAPAGTSSALVELRATKTTGSSGATVTANLDDVFFGLQGAPTECADPSMPFEDITASDALYVLRASVGTAVCFNCICDVNGTGNLTASDALATLRAAVGIPVSLDCPGC